MFERDWVKWRPVHRFDHESDHRIEIKIDSV